MAPAPPPSVPSVRVEDLGVVGAVPNGLAGSHPNMFDVGSVPASALNRNTAGTTTRFYGRNVRKPPRRTRGDRGRER